MANTIENRRQAKVERRKSPRAPVIVRVAYSTVDDFFSEFTQDINEGGVFIETDAPAELESQVHLQFDLPGADAPVKAIGRVVRVVGLADGEPAGMGIEFEELDAATREQINRLVQKLRQG